MIGTLATLAVLAIAIFCCGYAAGETTGVRFGRVDGYERRRDEERQEDEDRRRAIALVDRPALFDFERSCSVSPPTTATELIDELRAVRREREQHGLYGDLRSGR